MVKEGILRSRADCVWQDQRCCFDAQRSDCSRFPLICNLVDSVRLCWRNYATFFIFVHALNVYYLMVAEGVVMAIMHPGIAAGSATLAGIVLFKSNMF